MVRKVPRDKREDWNYVPNEFNQKEIDEREILMYDYIDTGPGQSGSPVMAAQQPHILGVHTGGSASRKKSWGTYITPAKLKWIVSSLGDPWNIGNDWGTLYPFKRT